MLIENKRNAFLLFLSGKTFTYIAKRFGVSSTTIATICEQVAIDLFKQYKVDGCPYGKYNGITKRIYPYSNNLRELRHYSDFWVRLIDDKEGSTLEKSELEISSFGFNKRTKQALLDNGIKTVKDLLNLTENKLLSFKNISFVSVEKIKTSLLKHGLELKDNVRNYIRYPLLKKEAVKILLNSGHMEGDVNNEPVVNGTGSQAKVYLVGNFTKAELMAYILFIDERNKND